VTVRAPLKYVDVNTLTEMSTAEVTAWVNHLCYLYGGSPSVTLTVDTGTDPVIVNLNPVLTGYTGTLATGGSITVSADFERSGGYYAWEAFDNNYDNEWDTYNDGEEHELKIVYGEAKTVTKITIGKTPNGIHYLPSSFTFEGSNDGSAWTNLLTVTGFRAYSVGVQAEFGLTSTGSYTQYRLLTTDSHSSTYIAIGKFECWGYGTAAPVAALSDTRKSAGALSNPATAFVAEASTTEPGTVTVTYDRVAQTYASVTPTADSGTTWPVYWDTASKSIIAMPIADIKDTFLHPAIDKLIAASESDTTAGTYTITTSATAATGYTNISTDAVFIDTRADTSAYSAAGIPETVDQPTTITSYFLHRRNQGSDGFGSLATPLIIADSGQTLTAQTTEGVIEGLFLEWIRETASESADGYKIVYSLATSGGNTRGTGMVDTRLNGAGDYQTLAAGIDDYRSQEFPNGSAVTISTYNLRITKA
jgi:hypothetical protein